MKYDMLVIITMYLRFKIMIYLGTVNVLFPN